jgi:hypothetical protein
MADGHKNGSAHPDLRAAAADWITIWQSELSAMAADRETREAWQRLIALWADAATAGLALIPAPPPHADQGRPAPPAPPPGSPAALAAPHAAAEELRRLANRVAELERQLAQRDPTPAAGSRG